MRIYLLKIDDVFLKQFYGAFQRSYQICIFGFLENSKSTELWLLVQRGDGVLIGALDL